jgi:imidazolonepropionase-like amidohydrolase
MKVPDTPMLALRDAVNQGLVEGPRMQVATRAIAAVGQYNPFGISPDVRDFPTGAQMISGPEEARRGAREQISFGADLLKVYADWGHPTLTIDEIRAVVEKAHKSHLKVAAHADSVDGIRNALIAGVDSIEHGGFAHRTSLELMKQKNVYWVPTKGNLFSRLDTVTNPGRHKYMQDVLNNARQNITLARELGVRITNGFDASSAEDQGHNGREIVAMCKLGLSPLEAIRAATATASELMGWQDKVGSIEPGKFADIVAVAGDPPLDISQVEHVKFVMKGGVVIKNEMSVAAPH